MLKARCWGGWSAAVILLSFLCPSGVYGEFTLIWSRSYTTARAGGSDSAIAVAIDRLGNIIVTGENTEDPTRGDGSVTTHKYDRYGNLLWRVFYQVPVGGGNGWNDGASGNGTAVDSFGNVYAGGWRAAPGGNNYDWVVRKYDSAGNFQWHREYGLAGSVWDQAWSMTIDNDGNTIPVGYCNGWSSPSFDWMIRKYDPAGNLLWSKTYDSAGAASYDDDFVSSACVATDNSVIVSGQAGVQIGGASKGYWLVRRYDQNGNLAWSTSNCGMPTVGNNSGAGRLAMDSTGNIIVAGGWDDGSGGIWLMVKLSLAGSLIWSRTYKGTVAGSYNMGGAAVDHNDNLYFGGTVPTASQGKDWMIRIYDKDGQFLNSSTTYNSPANADDSVCDMKIDAFGDLVVVGNETRSDLGQGINWRIIKYAVSYGRLDTSFSIDPGTIVSGVSFRVALTVTNAGFGTVSDVVPNLGIGSSPGAVTVTSGPAPASKASLAAGEAATFEWMCTGAAPGTVSLAGSVRGQDSEGNMLYGSAGASLTVLVPAGITAQAAVNPAAACGGGQAQVSVMVDNSGQTAANGVAVSAFSMLGTGSAALLAGPYPSTPVVVPAGGSAIFTFTYTGSAPGTVRFTATVTGTDALSGSPVSARSDGGTGVLAIASAKLEADALVLPMALCGRGNLLASLTVANTGQCPASGVTVQAMSLSGTGAARLLAGPCPSGPVSLAAGASVEFTFTYTGLAAGVVRFTATAAGTDAGTGAGLAAVAYDTSVLSQMAAPRLDASLSLENPAVIVGRACRIYLTVSNTGCGVATGISPVMETAASLVSLSAVEPAGAVAIPVGSSRTFTWTCSSLAEGRAVFSARVSGADQETGAALEAGASGELKISKIAPFSAIRDKLKPGRILVAPNNIKRGDEKAGVFMKGDPNGMVEIGFYSEIGHLAGTRYVKLDANGEGALEISRAELTSMGLGSGLCWVRAGGGGVKDKSPLIISPKGR